MIALKSNPQNARIEKLGSGFIQEMGLEPKNKLNLGALLGALS
jgi:hypothetical protein